MSNVGIYVIQSPTEKIYVGQSHDLETRKRKYINANCKDQPRIYNSIKKYGFDAHHFNVILELKEDISQTQLDYWEQFFIDHYRNEGYELLNLREGGSNGKMSEETRLKISNANKNPSIETRRKMSEWQKGKKVISQETKQKLRLANLGKVKSEKTLAKLRARKHTDESKLKMSLASKGKPKSEETKKKMSAWQIGRKMSEESKAKMRLRKMSPEQKEHLRKIKTGRRHSEETRKKMSESKKGIIKSPEWIEKIRQAKIGKPIKGHPISEENKLKLILSNKNRKGQKHTPEHKLKISMALKGRVITPETKEKMKLAWTKRKIKNL